MNFSHNDEVGSYPRVLTRASDRPMGRGESGARSTRLKERVRWGWKGEI